MQRYFQNLIEKLSIDETDLGKQVTEWKECLEKKKAVDFVRKSGSSKRGTNLESSDIDIVVLFKRGMVDTSIPVEFFATTAGDIRSCFREIQEMDHGFIYDKIPNTSVDIVIGYRDDKNPLVYWIPDKRNDKFVWIETSPEESERRVEGANKLISGKAGSYVRLMKYWNLRNGKLFNSFYLETLVIKKILTDSEKFNKMNYAVGIHYLFGYLQTAIDRKEPQPSGRGSHLGELKKEERKHLKKKLDYFITLSGDALDDAKKYDQSGMWTNIFGKKLIS